MEKINFEEVMDRLWDFETAVIEELIFMKVLTFEEAKRGIEPSELMGILGGEYQPEDFSCFKNGMDVMVKNHGDKEWRREKFAFCQDGWFWTYYKNTQNAVQKWDYCRELTEQK